ncbi:MAG TPA: SRPBCC family protein [Hyphomicrobiaceae bacterium]|nr:SRPBCC family protein [Hyphomicrobiaceae bacterium]
MPNLSETITIPAAIDDVWPLLRDPALVASCIPGAQLAPEQDGDAWKGSIRVKFGPTVAVFRGEATLAYDDAAKRCTITGRGIDQRGASRALANGVVTAAGAGSETKLTVDGEYTVTGPLETFANAGGVHVARALLAEFSANMGKVVAERGGAAAGPAVATEPSGAVAQAPAPGSAGAPTPPNPEAAAPSATATSQPIPRPAAAELSAGKLLWAALLSWLKSIFRIGSSNR